MAQAYEVIVIRDSTQSGAPVTGLVPTWVFCASLPSLVAVTSGNVPTVSEIGQGQYLVSWDQAVTGDWAGQLDAGAALSATSDRYIDLANTRTADSVAEGDAPVAGTAYHRRDGWKADITGESFGVTFIDTVNHIISVYGDLVGTTTPSLHIQDVPYTVNASGYIIRRG